MQVNVQLTEKKQQFIERSTLNHLRFTCKNVCILIGWAIIGK